MPVTKIAATKTIFVVTLITGNYYRGFVVASNAIFSQSNFGLKKKWTARHCHKCYDKYLVRKQKELAKLLIMWLVI